MACVEGAWMPIWTCPNTKCPYDRQLQPGQQCPLCGNEAAEFKFNEFGNLMKEKDSFTKSIKKARQNRDHLQRIKFCPKCGSTNINCLIFYRPSIWKCLDCGYEGAFIVEDSKLAEKKFKSATEKPLKRNTSRLYDQEQGIS